jgi:hypothetical protein
MTPQQELEVHDTLITVNKYFVDLQNRCKLTPYEERVWAKISKLMNITLKP